MKLLRAGAYDWVAAEAAGVGRRTFHRWVARGEADPSESPYGPFALDIMQAKAEARARAEVAVFETRPEVWLAKGGGRSKPGQPGWTEIAAGVEARMSEGQGEILAGIVAGVLSDLELPPEKLEAASASFRRRVAEMNEAREMNW